MTTYQSEVFLQKIDENGQEIIINKNGLIDIKQTEKLMDKKAGDNAQ